MSEQKLPEEIIDWMEQRSWGQHHVEWHAVRQWDTMSTVQRNEAIARGWQRAARQEGEAGNGNEFLMMHRAMLQLLREQFPQHAALFLGWATVPTDPDDPNDPVPAGNPRSFDPNKLASLQRLNAQLGGFSDEDDLGRFIETRRRPQPLNPFAVSSDASTGLHNYLHGRFSVPGSDIDMGDPEVNLGNARFWRLHGWIDARWTAFRQAKGLSDNDTLYRNALDREKAHLSHVAVHHHALAGTLVSTVLPAAHADRARLFSRPFEDTLALKFQRLMATTPRIETLAELRDYLQVAIELEHFTLPLYLTAMWSLKNAGPNTIEIRGILRGVAMQEMLHMGLACNLLKAIGGAPVIADFDAVPKYPGQPPGINLPDIGLERFSEDRIKLFLRIEEPEHGPIPHMLLAAAADVPEFHTIGEFYGGIDAGLDTVNAKTPGGLTFAAAGQLEADIDRDLEPGIDADQLTAIDSLAKAHAAIELIKQQGEGTMATQGTQGELAHYYRFEQIVLQKKYVPLPDGTWRIDPNSSLPLPTAAEVYPMAPVPEGGYPGDADAVAFDQKYTEMLQKLQQAWDQGDPDALEAAVDIMRGRLSSLGRALVKKPRPDGQGNIGPAFRFIPASTPPVPAPVGASPRAALAAGAAVPPPGYARIKQILDEAVNHEDIGAHGAFWRGLSRDQFVGKSIRGKKLLAETAPNVFDPDESNLVKALEGRAPFGADVQPPPPDAIFNRMPDGYPPVPQAKINEIRAWISAGCPDGLAAPPAAAAPMFAAGAALPVWIDPQAGGPTSAQTHIEFWRDFDNWAAFEVSEQVSADIDTFFAKAPLWLAAAKNPAQQPAWAQALTDPGVQQAVARLQARQRDTVVQHYGRPAPLLTLFDGWERFGDDTLPDDPQRPGDPHRMNGRTMWFFWSAFAEACLRLSATDATIPAEFWDGLSRAILVGLANDGLFRGRFPVLGFPATAEGKIAIRQHFQTLPTAAISGELAQRYRDSGL